MAYAAAHDLVVFTHDLDFGLLLAARKVSGPSVIQIRAQDLLPDAIGSIVLKSLTEVRSHLEAGARSDAFGQTGSEEKESHRITAPPISLSHVALSFGASLWKTIERKEQSS
jgi:Domain of unknown function (DUF5615)